MTAFIDTDLHLLSKEIQDKCKKKDRLTLKCFKCIQKIIDYIYVSVLNNLENDFVKKKLNKIQHKLIYLYKANKDEYSNIIDKDLIEDIVYSALGFSSNLNIKPFEQKEGGVFIIYCIMHYEFILFKKLNSISKLKALEYERLNNEIIFNIDLNDIEDEINDIIRKANIDKLLTKSHLKEFKQSLYQGIQYTEYKPFYDLIFNKVYE